MQVRSEDDFDTLVRGAKLLAIASAWSELGLWDELARHEGPVDLAELSGDPRALSITAAVLAHAGLLDGSGRRWTMSALAREMHARGQMPTSRNLGFLEDMGQMPAVLRDGGPVRAPNGTSKQAHGGVDRENPEAARRFLDMLYRRSELAARTTASWIGTRFAGGGRAIDVGGGHGRYAAALSERGFEVTLFDVPLVIGLARERHGDRLSYRAGDFNEDTFGGPYEVALLSNVVHGESDAACEDLMRRLFGALTPGGMVVLKDMFIDEQGRDPESAVFFGVTMLYYTAGGRTYTLRDVQRWCAAAGFEAPDAISVGGQSLVFVRKPG